MRLHSGLASRLGALFIRVLGATWRVEWRGGERLALARRMSPRIVFAFFHGRMLVLSYTHRGRDIQVLASHHYDGDLMGRVIAHLGFGHRKGSTTRGGAAALRDLAGALRGGCDVGLTIDGPRGPRGAVQQGAVEIARLGGSAVIAVCDSARPRWLMKTWDRLQIPFPFAKVVVAYGEPFLVPSGAGEAGREELRARLERELRDLSSSLDRELGYRGADVWPHENS